MTIKVWSSDYLPEAPPPELADLASRLHSLVERYPGHFSGAWYEPADELMHVGVADHDGAQILDDASLSTNQHLSIEDADRSFTAGQRLSLKLTRDPALRGVLVEVSPSPQGDGFVLGINGDEVPKDAVKRIKHVLPGQVTMFTGLSGGEAGVGGR